MRLNLDFFYRKKNADCIHLEDSKLARVLDTSDLAMLGIGCTFGTGIYILIGNVIANYAGPSVVLSFVVAGIASFLSGMAYAELGARVPRSGSAYVYIYVTIGEFIAFVIGWDLILEYMIGSASTANALSQYINSMCDNKIKIALKQAMPITVHGLNSYPDFLAFGFVLVVVGLLIIGVKESSALNKIFVFVNTAIISFIIIVGLTKADIHNWNLTKADFSSNWTYKYIKEDNLCGASADGCGSGGFFPYGFYGMMRGAAKCFYAYIGFDAICTTGEEVRNPLKALPLSIIITLVVCTVAYLGVAIVVTLMIPYFLIDSNAPLTSAFQYVNYEWAKYLVAIGATGSLITCLYASMFPLPRVVYSIASDGLIFRFLSKILPKVKTPAIATLVTGVLTAILAAIFDLDQLVEMTSIGTLLAYSLVSACLIVLRYRPPSKTAAIDNESEQRPIISIQNDSLLKRIFMPSTECTESSAIIVNVFTISAIVDILILCSILTFAKDLSQPYAIFLIILFGLLLLLFTFIIWRQPQNPTIETFKIPLVPFFPLVSIFINIYLMFSLALYTWIRFIVWFAIGFIVYFCYGIRNSNENKMRFSWFPCIQTSSDYDYSDRNSIKLEETQNGEINDK